MAGLPAGAQQIQDWKVASSLPAWAENAAVLGLAGPVCGVHQQAMIVAGGNHFPDSMPWQNGRKKYFREAYVWLPRSGKAKWVNEVFRLPRPVAYAAVCSTPEGIFYAGGENEQGIEQKSWLLKWNAGKSQLSATPLPDLPVPLTNAAAACSGMRVYVAGGEDGSRPTRHFFMLNLADINAGWQTLPPLPHAVSHTVLLTAARRGPATIYLVGGRSKQPNGISTLYGEVYAYSAEKEIWQEKKSLPYPISAASGIAFHPDRLLVFGGDRGTTFHRVEELIAAIAAETNPARKAALTLEKSELQRNHPGFSPEVWQYHIGTDTWTKAGTIPFTPPVTTNAVLNHRTVYLPCGEIRAGVRTAQIIAGHIE